MKNLSLLFIAFLLIQFSTIAQINEFKLLPSDGAQEDYFGGSVSISGEYAIVGAYRDDDNGYQSGSAYIFRRDGSNWTEEQKLLASDGAEFDQFGESVSISGNYAIVGAHGDDDNGDRSGSAYIFKRDGSNWTEEQKLLANDGSQYDFFGTSVSISGDYAIVGAYLNDDNGVESGSAYIFRRDGSNWTEEQKLLPSDGAQEDYFGQSVSISGDYSIVGAEGDDDNGMNSGSAYIFKRDGSNWTEEQKLLASDGAEYDQFGGSVSISGDYAIVGAHSSGIASLIGSAYRFKRESSNWTEEQKLLASDGDWFDQFGSSVSILGEYATVGASKNDDNGENSGSAYVYNGFVVSVKNEHLGYPLSFSLNQNYPNPFNPTTTIKYQIPEFSFVTIKVFDVLGSEIEALVNEEKQTGTYEITWYAKNLPSGIYFYRLQAGTFVETKKMILMK